MPNAASGHNNYWFWGPRTTGEIVIVVSRGIGDLPKMFEEVSLQGFVHDDTGYVQPSEDDLCVFVVRKPKGPIAAMWAHAKHFD